MPTGPIAVFGSGETSKRGRQVHAALLERLPTPVRIAIVETPAGFQPNVAVVSDKLRAFFEQSLAAFQPQVSVVAARRRGGVYDPDAPEIAAPLVRADYIFAGPGSPTYAVRHLAGTRTLELICQRLDEGATLAVSSAAAIAFGRCTLPVYEIYKAGEELHWVDGLDVYGRLGLNLTVLSHWNNTEGGRDLDTSHCFMGADRFRYLRRMLPRETTVLAVDEHTACILDPESGEVCVHGAGTATVIRGNREQVYQSGAVFPFSVLRGGD